jgi:SRSO17 transposase
MSASSSAPGMQQQRFAAYLDSLARAAGHADRAVPLQSYCTGLLLPGERLRHLRELAHLCFPKLTQTD